MRTNTRQYQGSTIQRKVSAFIVTVCLLAVVTTGAMASRMVVLSTQTGTLQEVRLISQEIVIDKRVFRLTEHTRYSGVNGAAGLNSGMQVEIEFAVTPNSSSAPQVMSVTVLTP